MATIETVYNRHLQFGEAAEPPPPSGDWEDLYNALDWDGLDLWYDANTGRTSTETLLDMGAQMTVSSSFLATRNVSNPDNFFIEGGRQYIQDVLCSNIRITAGITGLTIRQSQILRRGASYLYCIHAPSSVPSHDIIIEDCDIDGENIASFAVYFPATNYVADDIVVRRCKIHHFQSMVHATWGTTVDTCLIHDLFYLEGSHNTAMSFRGGQGKAYRNRIRPGTQGSSGINFYAELDTPDYNFLYLIENIIMATEADATVNFPERDEPPGDPCAPGSVCFSALEPYMTRTATGNVVGQDPLDPDTGRFSNSHLWQIWTDNIQFDGSPAPG